MERLVPLLVVFLSVSISADKSPLIGIPCREAMQKTLRQWEESPRWRKTSPQTWASPTSQLGRWIEVHFPDTAYLLSPEGTTRARWSGPKCQERNEFIAYHWDENALKKNFSDLQLRELVASGSKGVIHAWSPHMPISIKAIPALRKATSRLGLRLITVLDPAADRRHAEVAALRHKLGSDSLKRLESIELLQRGMTIHFPSLVVFANGKILGELIPGAKDEELYVQLLRKELGRR